MISQRWSRSAEKEAYWRGHLERQWSSGELIRGYCRLRGVSEESFHFWRREIGNRDREATQKRGTGVAGLIAVEVVGDSRPSPVLEISCPGDAVIRLREEASRVILHKSCRQVIISPIQRDYTHFGNP